MSLKVRPLFPFKPNSPYVDPLLTLNPTSDHLLVNTPLAKPPHPTPFNHPLNLPPSPPSSPPLIFPTSPPKTPQYLIPTIQTLPQSLSLSEEEFGKLLQDVVAIGKVSPGEGVGRVGCRLDVGLGRGEKEEGRLISISCFALLCFALLCFALLCFALLCFGVIVGYGGLGIGWCGIWTIVHLFDRP